MLPYFLLLFSVSLPALLSPRRASGTSALLASFLLIIFIGLRYQTGGDWWNYYSSVLQAYGVPLREFFLVQRNEPLYGLLNWFGANQFGGLVLVNSVVPQSFLFLFCDFVGSALSLDCLNAFYSLSCDCRCYGIYKAICRYRI